MSSPHGAPWYEGSQEVDSEAAAQERVQYFDNGNSGSAVTVNIAAGRVQNVTLTASGPTITVKAPATATYRFQLILTQDGTGSRTVPTFSPAADYGTAGAPTLTTTAGKKDILDCLWVSGTLYVLSVAKGF